MRISLVSSQSSQEESVDGGVVNGGTLKPKSLQTFSPKPLSGCCWGHTPLPIGPLVCVLSRGFGTWPLHGCGVWFLWQTIGQKWRLKCFALSLVIGNYKKNRLSNEAMILFLLLYGYCFKHFLFPFYPWFVCCPGGSECDHEWKWGAVDVTDKSNWV